MNTKSKPKVVIIGGGFGGLQAAKHLANKPVNVTLIDKKNHHTFQPLLYQVATAVLSPGEIATPIRRILYWARNVEVILCDVKSIDKDAHCVALSDGAEVKFDYLIAAAGASHFYFGHDNWEVSAPGLKTVEDALEIRRRVLLAFELAERDASIFGDHDEITFVIVGGGPTGVELAGAVAGIAREALAHDFKLIDTRKARVLLLEGSDRVLGTFDKSLSERAKSDLESLGVTVRLKSYVTDIKPGRVKVADEWIDTTVAIWATGVLASPIGKSLSKKTDEHGRVPVNPDLSIPDDPNIFVIGDLARFVEKDGSLVPGLAQGALQMADVAAANVLASVNGGKRKEFTYRNKGTMATIGRNRAVAEIGNMKFTGFFAFMLWGLVHVFTLIGFKNRLAVMTNWIWYYFSRERGARLITGDADELHEALIFLEAGIAHEKNNTEKKQKNSSLDSNSAKGVK